MEIHNLLMQLVVCRIMAQVLTQLLNSKFILGLAIPLVPTDKYRYWFIGEFILLHTMLPELVGLTLNVTPAPTFVIKAINYRDTIGSAVRHIDFICCLINCYRGWATSYYITSQFFIISSINYRDSTKTPIPPISYIDFICFWVLYYVEWQESYRYIFSQFFIISSINYRDSIRVAVRHIDFICCLINCYRGWATSYRYIFSSFLSLVPLITETVLEPLFAT